jgi:ABC-type polysaccharide/polyol phosphate export permease
MADVKRVSATGGVGFLDGAALRRLVGAAPDVAGPFDRLIDGVDPNHVARLDLAEAMRRLPLALYFAWSDTRARYKRSVLGPFWLVITTLIGVVGLGIIWSILLKVNRSEFLPPLTIGLVVWQMLAGCLADAPGLFYRQPGQIKDINLPAFLITLQLVLRHLINFAHNLLVVAVVFLVFEQRLSFTALLAAPGLVIVLLNLLWVVQLLGLIGARFRDVDPLVAALLPILFFLSPVIYRAKQLGALRSTMAFNPLAYWIDLISQPLLGIAPSGRAYAVALAITGLGWLATLWATSRNRSRLPYWI